MANKTRTIGDAILKIEKRRFVRISVISFILLLNYFAVLLTGVGLSTLVSPQATFEVSLLVAGLLVWAAHLIGMWAAHRVCEPSAVRVWFEKDINMRRLATIFWLWLLPAALLPVFANPEAIRMPSGRYLILILTAVLWGYSLLCTWRLVFDSRVIDYRWKVNDHRPGVFIKRIQSSGGRTTLYYCVLHLQGQGYVDPKGQLVPLLMLAQEFWGHDKELQAHRFADTHGYLAVV